MIKNIHQVDIVTSKPIGSVSITMSGLLFTQYCVNRHFHYVITCTITDTNTGHEIPSLARVFIPATTGLFDEDNFIRFT